MTEDQPDDYLADATLPRLEIPTRETGTDGWFYSAPEAFADDTLGDPVGNVAVVCGVCGHASVDFGWAVTWEKHERHFEPNHIGYKIYILTAKIRNHDSYGLKSTWDIVEKAAEGIEPRQWGLLSVKMGDRRGNVAQVQYITNKYRADAPHPGDHLFNGMNTEHFADYEVNEKLVEPSKDPYPGHPEVFADG